jgi:hypothetical protein
MNEKVLKALLAESAVKKVKVIASGGIFHVEIKTLAQTALVCNSTGNLKNWRTLDACARWLHKIGIGTASIEIGLWQPDQKVFSSFS